MHGSTDRTKTKPSASRGIIMAGAWGLAVLLAGLPSTGSAQLGFRVDPRPMTGAVNQSLNVINNNVARGLNQMTRSVNRGLGQVNTSVNRSLNAINSYNYRPPVQVRYPNYGQTYRPPSLSSQSMNMARSSNYTPRTAARRRAQRQEPVRLTEEQLASLQQHQAALARTRAGLGILPPAILAQLTDMQAGLQNAAQEAAFDSPVGEIIEWTYEGAAGSAQALSEDRFGTMICREFKQTMVFDGVEEAVTATASACRRGNGQWARSVY